MSLEKLLARLRPSIGLLEPVVVPETGRFTLFVDGSMEIAISALDQRQVLIEAVVRELKGDEPGNEDYLRQLLRRSTGRILESQSVLTIDPTTRCVVLFSTGNVENMEADRAALWLEAFLNDLESLRSIPVPAPTWEMPFRFLRP